jgi:Rod binding domain-containing protein
VGSSGGITGSMMAQAQTSLLQTRQEQAIRQLKAEQGAQPGSSDDAKIDKSAKDFESMLLNTWLQQAEQSMGSVPGAEDDEDAGQRDQMMSLGVQALSTSLAASGGIGIAKMISKALHASADQHHAADSAGAAEGQKIEK